MKNHRNHKFAVKNTGESEHLKYYYWGILWYSTIRKQNSSQ